MNQRIHPQEQTSNNEIYALLLAVDAKVNRIESSMNQVERTLSRLTDTVHHLSEIMNIVHSFREQIGDLRESLNLQVEHILRTIQEQRSTVIESTDMPEN